MGSDNRYAILAHQSANPAMTNVQPQLLQFFGHSGAAVALQAQAVLLPDMGEQNQVSPLAAAGWVAPPGPIPA